MGVLFRIHDRRLPVNWQPQSIESRSPRQLVGNDSSYEVTRVASTTSRVTRGEAILNKLADTTVITPGGRDFLIASLDPMHDNQLKDLSGWPDAETAASVTRLIKQSLTVKLPQSSTVSTYDVHFIHWPWLNAGTFCTGQRINSLCNYGQPTTLPQILALGGMCVYIVPTGSSLDLSLSPDFILTLDSVYSDGPNRIVGSGFEVVNTTAEIYKQGQLCVWRMPQSYLDPTTVQISGTGALTTPVSNISCTGMFLNCPPRNFAEAMLVPGTRQWKAADGVYAVCPHISADNPASLPDYTQPIIPTRSDTADKVPNGVPQNTGWNTYSNQAFILVPPFDETSAGVRTLRTQKIYPLHLCGSIFTGLTSNSTLTLSWNVFIETFPTLAQKDILVLSRPSSSLDEVALKLYGECLTSLPVGVPAADNPFGEWFAEVVESITDFLTPGALALGMPAVAAVSKGANSLAKGYLDKRKEGAEAVKKFLATPSPQQSLRQDRQMASRALAPRRKPPGKKKKAMNNKAAIAAGVANAKK